MPQPPHDSEAGPEDVPGCELPGRYRPGIRDLMPELEQRRSVPLAWLSEPGPTGPELERILAVACRVPDHGQLEPWRFIVIEGDARYQLAARLVQAYLEEFPASEAGQRERISASITRTAVAAPLIVIVVSSIDHASPIPEWEQVLSAGAVCMSLLMALHARGFAGNWLTSWPAYSLHAHSILGIEAGEKVAGIIYAGTAVKAPDDRRRPELRQKVRRWGC